jgi:2-polyprenyl-6-methoxyphenol hydroxylase-like FAD-dependent oxidoreductase
MSRPRALVIGGSLGGLFAGNLLRAAGWDVAVFERGSIDLAGRGAGLGAQAALFSVMRRIGIPIDESFCTPHNSRVCLDRRGDVVCEIPLPEATTAWDRIYGALKQALPRQCLHPGKVFERLDQDEAGVTASFADGSHARGQLLIGADGMRSTVRGQMLPELGPRYAGYVAWRGIVEVSCLPAAQREMTSRQMVFCFPKGEMAFSVPMAATETQASGRGPRCMFVWFRPADHATKLRELCTDAQGLSHGVSIPPPLIRPEVLDELRTSATTLLAPQIAALVEHAQQPILSPIFDLESPRVCWGRVALVGDAAFAARPHVGSGVTKAALDAQSLADALSGGEAMLPAALARYDAERCRFGKWLVARGRYLGSHLEYRSGACRPPDGAAPELRIETYLREYGAAGVVHGETIAAHCV